MVIGALATAWVPGDAAIIATNTNTLSIEVVPVAHLPTAPRPPGDRHRLFRGDPERTDLSSAGVVSAKR
jgi:hypothetical protein